MFVLTLLIDCRFLVDNGANPGVLFEGYVTGDGKDVSVAFAPDVDEITSHKTIEETITEPVPEPVADLLVRDARYQDDSLACCCCNKTGAQPPSTTNMSTNAVGAYPSENATAQRLAIPPKTGPMVSRGPVYETVAEEVVKKPESSDSVEITPANEAATESVVAKPEAP